MGYLQNNPNIGSSNSQNIFKRSDNHGFIIKEPDLFLKVKNIYTKKIAYTRNFDLSIQGNPYLVVDTNWMILPKVDTNPTFDSQEFKINTDQSNILEITTYANNNETIHRIPLYRPIEDEGESCDGIYFNFHSVDEIWEYSIEYGVSQISTVNVIETVERIKILISKNAFKTLITPEEYEQIKGNIKLLEDKVTQTDVSSPNFNGPFYIRNTYNLREIFRLYDYLNIKEIIQKLKI